MNNGELKTLGWKILPWLADVVCALLVYWATQINTQLKTMSQDIAALQLWKAETSGNRYTSSDHVRYAEEQARVNQSIMTKMSDQQMLWLKDIADVKLALAQVPKTGDLPPVWFREYVKSIEVKLDEHMKESRKP